MRGTPWFLAPLILGPGAGQAQVPDSLARGTIIRVSRDCGSASADRKQTGCRPERGALVQADSAGLTWRPGGSSVAQLTRWSQIGDVEISRGKRGHAGTGALAGAIAAAVPGALSGMAFAEITCECSHPNYAGGALFGALIFAGPGALAGAIIGQLVRTERWEAVPVDRLRVTIIPEARRLGIGLALRF